jgi:hypothetical protein
MRLTRVLRKSVMFEFEGLLLKPEILVIEFEVRHLIDTLYATS